MPKAYSAEFRERVIARVESGASRREAAEHYEISVSTAAAVRRRAGSDRFGFYNFSFCSNQ